MNRLGAYAERVGSIAILTLNRAERHNSLVPELLEDLLAALEAIVDDRDVRAVVLQAKRTLVFYGRRCGRLLRTPGRTAGLCHRIVGLLNQAILALVDAACRSWRRSTAS